MPLAPVQPLTGKAFVDAIKRKALELGFDLVGIASAEPSQHRVHFRRWLDAGHAGTMDYLARRFDERADVGVYLPGAASVVCVAMNYHTPLQPPPADGPNGRVARYALGDDYHDVIKPRLYDLADWIREQSPGTRTKCGVDTVPVLERELAARAGIGWVGKNTLVIHPRFGSWLLLGEVVTTVPLPPDEPITDHCGSCTRCIEACPTQAITRPYHVDASRCISYLTIEHRAEGTDDDGIAPELRERMGDWLYGCDVCQEVCPHNGDTPITPNPAFRPRFPSGTLNVDKVQAWDDAEYSRNLRRSAMKRVKLPILQRNAKGVSDRRSDTP